MGLEILAGAAVGLVGSSMQASATESAGDAAAAVQREQLDFQKEQYDDWKDIYGPLQESMGEYYMNLTGESMTNKEIEAIQIAGQKANEQISTQIAQRGISGSGVEASLINQNIYQTEIQKALVSTTADERANQERMKFLSLGLGQGAQISSQMAQTSGQMASSIQSTGAQQSAIIGGATKELGGIVGYAFDQYGN